MKKIILIILLCIILYSGLEAVAITNFKTSEFEPIYITTDETSINTTINVGYYKIKNIDENHEISIDSFGRLSIPGVPNLPSRIFSIAIPNGIKIKDVIYNEGEGIIIPGTYNISPAQLPQINDGKNTFHSKYNIEIFNKNYNSIYNKDDVYPVEIVKFVRTSKYRKYDLIDLQITPITYQPLSGQLKYYQKIKIDIIYEKTVNKSAMIIDYSKRIEQNAKEIIYNYDQVRKWYPINNIISKGLHDFVIITLESLESAVTSLANWEIQKGRTVQVVTTSWIDLNYEGYDLAEKIRNFLRDKYPSNDWGIEDVLIVGHRDDIPMRRTWQSISSSYEKPETDFYFAELSLPDNQSWDADGDHQYAENSDPIDFYAEVNVGRIPWSDYEIVSHICDKSIVYEQNTDPSFKNNILLLAAFVDDNTDGATFMEYSVNSTIHPWMTHWMKTRMYQKGSNYAMHYLLTHFNVVNVWASGKYAFVSWHGHGSPIGSYIGHQAFITSEDCSLLNDNYPAIISAASCSNSDTDYINIGQAMMKQGAVGFLGANKVAYYCSGWDDQNDGSDQSFKYFFISSVISGNKTQGQSHQFAIREMYTRGLWYSLKYETFVHGSLWGNPNLGMGSIEDNNSPEKPSRPNGPTSGKIRKEHTFTTSTIDPENDDIYYLFDWNDGSSSGWLGPYRSDVTVEGTHIWTNAGNYEIKVISQDINGAKSEWSDPLPISMPKNKYNSNSRYFWFYDNLPFMFQIIKNILRL